VNEGRNGSIIQSTNFHADARAINRPGLGEITMRQFLTASILLMTTTPLLAQPAAPLSTEGRFLYANDDDWDWASPLGSNIPSRLADTYGKMPWSALDWMEQGLPEVRGMLVGIPPVLGNYLTMADLNKQRGAGPKVAYDHLPHKHNTLSDLLHDKKPPNVVILMQDNGLAGPPPISNQDVTACFEFVARGGRLLVLDDWQYYRVLVSPFLDAKKFPPMKSPPASAQDKKKALEQIKLLDHEQFVVREKAGLELTKLGGKIVSVLEEFKGATPEQQLRINKLIQQLKPVQLPLTPVDGDKWMLDTARTASHLHKLCDLKLISRNANKEAGSALCLRLPAMQAGK
jgi:hypothetical protein